MAEAATFPGGMWNHHRLHNPNAPPGQKLPPLGKLIKLKSEGSFPGSSNGVWLREQLVFQSGAPYLGSNKVSPRSLQAHSDDKEYTDDSFTVVSTRWHSPLCACSTGWRVTERLSFPVGPQWEGPQTQGKHRLSTSDSYEMHVLGVSSSVFLWLWKDLDLSLHKDIQIITQWKPIRRFVSLITAFLFEKDFHQRGQPQPQN